MARREEELSKALAAARTPAAKGEAALALADLADEALRRADELGAASFASVLSVLRGLLAADAWGVRTAAATALGLVALSVHRRGVITAGGGAAPAGASASSALGALLLSAPPVDAGAAASSRDVPPAAATPPPATSFLTFRLFDMRTVLGRGQPLVAHDPARYAAEAARAAFTLRLTPAQRLLLQRAEALRVIGLDAAAEDGADAVGGGTAAGLRVTAGLADAVVGEEDMAAAAADAPPASTWADGGEVAAVDAVASEAASSHAATPSVSSASSTAAAPMSLAAVAFAPYTAALASLLRELSAQLFHPSWTHRHGAAAALREVLWRLPSPPAAHPPSAGVGSGAGSSASSSAAAAADGDAGMGDPAAQDVALRCMVLLALDRFGDYGGGSGSGGEQSSGSAGHAAPVRETAAQTLALALRHLPPRSASFSIRSLLTLAAYGAGSGGGSPAASSSPSSASTAAAPSAPSRPLEWTLAVRHGAFLGLRAAVAVQTAAGAPTSSGDGADGASSSSSLLPAVAQACLQALHLSGAGYADLALRARKAAAVAAASASDASTVPAAAASALLNVGATEEVIAAAAETLQLLLPLPGAAASHDAASSDEAPLPHRALSQSLDCLDAVLASSDCPSSPLAAALLALAAHALQASSAAGSSTSAAGDTTTAALLPRVAAVCIRLARHPLGAVRLRAATTLTAALERVAAAPPPGRSDVNDVDDDVDGPAALRRHCTWWARQGLPACLRSLWRALLLEPARAGVSPRGGNVSGDEQQPAAAVGAAAASTAAAASADPRRGLLSSADADASGPPPPGLVDVLSAGVRSQYVEWLRDLHAGGLPPAGAGDSGGGGTDQVAALERACLRGIDAALAALASIARDVSLPGLTAWAWLPSAVDALANTADGDVVAGPAVDEPLLVLPQGQQQPPADAAASTAAASAPVPAALPAPSASVAQPPQPAGRGRGRGGRARGRGRGGTQHRGGARGGSRGRKRAAASAGICGERSRDDAITDADMIGEEDLSDLSDFDDGDGGDVAMHEAVGDAAIGDRSASAAALRGGGDCCWSADCVPSVPTGPSAAAGGAEAASSAASMTAAAQTTSQAFSGFSYHKRAVGAAAVAAIAAGFESVATAKDAAGADSSSSPSSSQSPLLLRLLAPLTPATHFYHALVTSQAIATFVGRATAAGNGGGSSDDGGRTSADSVTAVASHVLAAFPPLLAAWAVGPGAGTPPPAPSLPTPGVLHRLARRVWSAAIDAYAALSAARACAERVGAPSQQQGGGKAATSAAAAAPIDAFARWTTAAGATPAFAGLGTPAGPPPPEPAHLTWGLLALSDGLAGPVATAVAKRCADTAAAAAAVGSAGATSSAAASHSRAAASSSASSAAALAELAALAEEASYYAGRLREALGACLAGWAAARARVLGALGAAMASVVATATAPAATSLLPPAVVTAAAELKLTPLLSALLEGVGGGGGYSSASGNSGDDGSEQVWSQAAAGGALAALLRALSSPAAPGRRDFTLTWRRLLDALLRLLEGGGGGEPEPPQLRGAALALQCYVAVASNAIAPPPSSSSIASILSTLLTACADVAAAATAASLAPSSTQQQLPATSGAVAPAASPTASSTSSSSPPQPPPLFRLSLPAACRCVAALLAGPPLSSSSVGGAQLGPLAQRLLGAALTALAATVPPPPAHATALRAGCAALLHAALTHNAALWCGSLLHGGLLRWLRPTAPVAAAEAALALLAGCLADVTATCALPRVAAAESATAGSVPSPPPPPPLLLLPLETVVGRVSSLLFSALLPLLNHASSPAIRTHAAVAFRAVVRLLPLDVAASSAPPADDPLLSQLPPAVLRARARSAGVVASFTAGAVAALHRLPVSVTAEVMPVPPAAAAAPAAGGVSGGGNDAAASSNVPPQAPPPPPADTAAAELLPPLPPGVSLPPGLALRPYQRAGIAWLRFLARHGLHGVLGDDMGLGKTGQALCAVALQACDGDGGNGDDDEDTDDEEGASAGAGAGQSSSSSSAAAAAPAPPRPSPPPPPAVSVIVCPPSVVHHWTAEVARFFGAATVPPAVAPVAAAAGIEAASAPPQPSMPLFRCVAIAGGTAAERAQALADVAAHVVAAPSERACRHLLVVTSYPTLRREGGALADAVRGVCTAAAAPAPSASSASSPSSAAVAGTAAAVTATLPSAGATASPLPLLYAVLDEGHVIHNPASATSAAARSLGGLARHRLVLTGTPVQNSVGDVWALLDFLMPGYLGSAAAFRRSVAAPVERAKSPSATDADVAAARAALRGLHRSILPFVLRRLKGDVLAELPPKVVSDVLVDLTPLQAALYAALARSSVLREATWRGLRLREVLPLEEGSDGGGGGGGSSTGGTHAADTDEGAAADGASSSSAAAAAPAADTPSAAAGGDGAGGGGSGARSAFAALAQLQAVCNHPALLPQAALEEAVAALRARAGGAGGGSSDGDGVLAAAERLTPGDVTAGDFRSLSAKLVALRELLTTAGIAGGVSGGSDEDEEDDGDYDGVGGDEDGDGRSRRRKRRQRAAAAPPEAAGRKRRRRAAAAEAASDDSDNDSDGGGAGAASSTSSAAAAAAPQLVLPRKALVFSRFPRMLDAAEAALTRGRQPLLPRAAVARMDGATPAGDRAGLAARFNASPSLRVLLLTTGVGGLGLNLTGADTVVFLDHDWNPARDAQAADRAHRLGQTASCVSVFRLLARGTLEERVLSTQAWKTGVLAGALVGGREAGDPAAMLAAAPLAELLLGPSGDGGGGGGGGAPSSSSSSSAAAAAATAAAGDGDDGEDYDGLDLASFVGRLRAAAPGSRAGSNG